MRGGVILAFRGGLVCVALALAACERKAPAAPVEPPSPRPQEAEVPPAPPRETGPLIAFLGDSITAGYELRADEAYPALLQAQLASAGTPVRIVNAGVSGDTTAGGLRRVDWLLTQKPDVVVIELGANDGLRGASVAEIERNLTEIIAKVRAAGAVPLLVGMLMPPSHGQEYARAFATLYPELAHKLDVALAPQFMAGVAGQPELNLPDGIHPTARGHALLAENLAPPLIALLHTLRPRTSR
jgi:acyl-CoA thioesterase-1